MKLIHGLMLVAGVVDAPAWAAPDEISVSAAPTRTKWAERVVRRLGNALANVDNSPRIDVLSGIVTVMFVPGRDGRPAEARFVRSSRVRLLDQVALRAVVDMKTMLPLPRDVGAHQTIMANLVFAQSQQDYDLQVRRLRSEPQTVALSALERTALVLNPLPQGTVPRSNLF